MTVLVHGGVFSHAEGKQGPHSGGGNASVTVLACCIAARLAIPTLRQIIHVTVGQQNQPCCIVPNGCVGAVQFEIATTFGAFLDPVADKVMVTTVLVLLSTGPPEPISQAQMAVPVILICCREVTMSALREWAASASSSAHKVRLGLWQRGLAGLCDSLLGYLSACLSVSLCACLPVCLSVCLLVGLSEATWGMLIGSNNKHWLPGAPAQPWVHTLHGLCMLLQH